MKHSEFFEVVSKLKTAVDEEIKRCNFEQSLNLIEGTSKILYSVNQYYCDDVLEENIGVIIKSIYGEENSYEPSKNVILFYDGFGLNSRGLVQIYLKALCNIGKVIYVTDSKNKGSIPDVLRILRDGNSDTYYINNKEKIKRIDELKSVFEKYKPECAFLYTTPDDVVGVGGFCIFGGCLKRYLINLTDHAFWLGKKACDYFIEYRDYGASVSTKFRGLDKNKLVKLPFYPQIDRNIVFEGFPEGMNANNRFVFSGGSLYKTIGGNGLYYKIIEHILDNYSDVCFWYAGSGESKYIYRLIQKYPKRVFFTKERKDFFQIIERCYLYLSTYPLSGGLMFQYAAAAGKVPLTLKYSDISDGHLLEQDKLQIEFRNIEEFKLMLDKILTNEAFMKSKSSELKSSVISETCFEQTLRNILYSCKTDFNFEIYSINSDKFRQEYLNRYELDDLYVIISSSKYKAFFKYLPCEFIKGRFVKFFRKIKKLCNCDVF